MEEEIVIEEVKRVVKEIDKFIGLMAKMRSLNEEIFFDEKLISNVKSICLKTIAFCFNEVISSDDFSKETRKRRIDCLTCYKQFFSKMIE